LYAIIAYHWVIGIYIQFSKRFDRAGGDATAVKPSKMSITRESSPPVMIIAPAFPFAGPPASYSRASAGVWV
jgi:hypothetical protein